MPSTVPNEVDLNNLSLLTLPIGDQDASPRTLLDSLGIQSEVSGSDVSGFTPTYNDVREELKNLTDEELIALARHKLSPAKGETDGLDPALTAKVPTYMTFDQQEEARNAPDGLLAKTGKMAFNAVHGGLKGIVDAGTGVAVGAAKGTLQTATVAVDALNWLDDAAGWDMIPNEGVEKVRERTDAMQETMNEWVPADSLPGSLGKFMGSYGIGTAAVGGIMRGAQALPAGNNLIMGAKMALGPRWTPVVAHLAKDAAATVLANDPDEGRFVDFLKDFPALQNAFTEYLQTDPSDSLAEKRFKQTVDSVLGEVAYFPVSLALNKVGRWAKKWTSLRDKAVSGKPLTQPEINAEKTAYKEAAKAVSKAEKEAAALSAPVLPSFDEDAALAEAQRLYAEGVAGGTVRPEFRPTHDVTNAARLNKVILEDGGVANLLNLGNDVDANVLNRPKAEFSRKSLAQTAQEAKDILSAYSGEPVTQFADMAQTAEFAETLAAKVVAAKEVVSQGAFVLGDTLKKLDDAAVSGVLDDALQGSLLKDTRTALKNYATAASLLDRISTGTGRALSAHRILSESGAVDPGKGVATALETLSAFFDNMSDGNAVALARRLTALGDPVKGAKMLRVANDKGVKKAVGMVTEYWMNSILSGIPTFARNMVGNTVQFGALMPLHNMVQGWGGFKGGLFSIHDRELWDRGVYLWWGAAQSFRESWSAAMKSLKLGASLLKADGAGWVPSHVRRISAEYSGVASDSLIGKTIDAFGKAVNLPSRYLMASDEFASQLAYRAHVRTYLMTQANEIYAKALPNSIKKTRREFVTDFIADKLPSFFQDGAGGVRGNFKPALETAMEATFTKPLASGSIGASLQQLSNRHALVKHVMPFVRTPANILDEALIHIPGLNLLSREFHQARALGGEAWERAKAKMTVGTALTAVVMNYCVSGDVTGGGPKDRATKELLMENGWRPYSIKVGDTWYSYAHMEPVASLIGTLADMSELYSASVAEDTFEGGASDYARAALDASIFAAAKNLASKSYVSGLNEAIEAISSGKPGKLLTQYATSYIPNLFGNVAKITDPTVREVRGILDMAAAKIPGYSSTLPVKYSWLTGKPITYTGGMASGFSPVVWSQDKEDPALEKLAKHADKITFPSPSIKGVNLSAQEQSDYYRLHGTVTIGGMTLLEALRELVTQTTEGDEDDEVSDALVVKLNKVVNKYRTRAKAQFLQEHPGFATPQTVGMTAREAASPPLRQQKKGELKPYDYDSEVKSILATIAAYK